ncbi:MAG: GNAT family N-acetyltransferase [Cytophagales bacterium]|nr:GNAT family N-acetyltransferase [Cytophagales bacterium]
MGKYIIQTDRLGLRTWTTKDLEPMSQFNADERVMEYFPSTKSVSDTKAFIESQQRAQAVEGYCFFAAEVLATQSLIGFIGILKFKFDVDFAPGVEVGWRLGHAHWGKGYATEGARAVLKFAFEEKNIPEIWSFTTLTNTRSENVMKKIGMSRTGTFDHPLVDEGHPLKPHVLYHLTRP